MQSSAPTSAARDGLERLERAFDRVFGAAANPLRHLGALIWGCFWLIALSGLYLFILFDTSRTGAWQSVQALEGAPAGSLARALHRYASDAFLLLCVLHLLREAVLGRFRGVRWFTWVSGVPLLWLAWLAGVVGFWLVWDQLGLFSAAATLEWLDELGMFAESLPRNFLYGAGVDDRLFSLFVFTHVGVSLLLLLGMWLHTQRLSRADTFPSRALAIGFTLALVVLSLAQPAPLAGPADLRVIPASLEFDWFYLAPHVFQYAASAPWLWTVALGVTVALTLLPWLPSRRTRPATARVEPEHCNGCARCFADCPYAAITMLDTPARKGLGQLAVVDADLCAGCGICAGACPSSTPFRSDAQLVSGIDMPQLGVDTLRAALQERLRPHGDAAPVLVVGCEHGVDARTLEDRDTVGLNLLCAGQLPPAFVDYALRSGARGVVVAACAQGGCEFRLGEQWAAQRLTGLREPHLRASVDPLRWVLVHAGRTQVPAVRAAIENLRMRSAAHA